MKERRSEQIPAVVHGGVDRLSALPDAILVDILRSLPLGSAAATSTLSRHWRHIWTERTSIVIDFNKLIFRVSPLCAHLNCVCPYLTHKEIVSSFTTVNHILGQLKSPKLRTFELLYTYPLVPEDDEDDEGGDDFVALSSCLDSWLGLICGRNVEVIKLVAGDSPGSESFVWLPSCVFRTHSLVKLVLQHGNYNCKLPEVVTLPNLKYLEMDLTSFEDFHSRLLATLSESCPLLQDLYLRFHRVKDALLINIPSRSLKCLSIVICSEAEESKRGKFVIDAPKLDYIKIWGELMVFEFVTKPTTLAKADIAIYSDNYGEMFGLVNGISCARSLVLADGYGRIINSLNYWEDEGGLALFGELIELYIVLSSGKKTDWPNRLPILLLTKLKKIKIVYRKRIDVDMNLVKFILSNSFDLELLSVFVGYGVKFNHYEEERKLCEEIFKLERSSVMCEIQFTGDYINESSSSSESRDLASEGGVGCSYAR